MDAPPVQEFRVRLPREGEIFAVVEGLNGGKRMTVKCEDGKIRMARIPGRLKSIFVRQDDLILIKPWEVQGDKKSDVVWRYKQNEIEWLRRNNKIPNFD